MGNNMKKVNVGTEGHIDHGVSPPPYWCAMCGKWGDHRSGKHFDRNGEVLSTVQFLAKYGRAVID